MLLFGAILVGIFATFCHVKPWFFQHNSRNFALNIKTERNNCSVREIEARIAEYGEARKRLPEKMPERLNLSVPSSFNIKLANIEQTYFSLEREAADACNRMLKDARKNGHKRLAVTAAYRSRAKQTELFEKEHNRLVKAGEDNAHHKATLSVAIPGTSEHEIGLAVDIGVLGLGEDIDWTKEWKWLYENSPQYGFILRYPKNKVGITGKKYEPWHFRYVGVEEARFITHSDLCLEELYSTMYFKMKYV